MAPAIFPSVAFYSGSYFSQIAPLNSLTSKRIVCPFFSKSRSCWVFAPSTRYAYSNPSTSVTLLLLHILSPFQHNDQRHCFHQELQSCVFFFFLHVMHKAQFYTGGIMRWWNKFKQMLCGTSLPARQRRLMATNVGRCQNSCRIDFW